MKATHWIYFLISWIGLSYLGYGIYTSILKNRHLETQNTEYRNALDLLSHRYQVLDSCNSYNIRRIEAIKYTYCTLLEGKYQFTPAITASWQQFNGLTEYVMTHYPKRLTRCTCDSILNSQNQTSDLEAELLIQNSNEPTNTRNSHR